MACAVLQIVVNPEPEQEAASQASKPPAQASKRPAQAQAKKDSDRKHKRVKEQEAKQPGVPPSEHASTHLSRQNGLECWEGTLC